MLHVRKRLVKPRDIALLYVVLITFFGATLRLHRLNAVPLRGDEAFTVLHWMREPLAETFARIVTVDPQGPVNYVLYRAYALIVGSEELVVRFMPALVSLIAVPAMYALGKAISGRRAGLMVAALWAAHPFALWHAQDARSYAVWSVANPLALWAACRALTVGRRVDWAVYVGFAALSLYVYYLELFTVAALNLFVLGGYLLGRFQRLEAPLLSMHVVRRWIAAQVIIVLIVAPWYLQERLLSGGGYAGTTSGFSLEVLVGTLIPSLFLGELGALDGRAALIAWLACAAAVVLLFGARVRFAGLLILLMVVPVIALSLVSLRLNVFAARYILSVSIAATAVCGIAAVRVRGGTLLAVGLLAVQFGAIRFYFHDYAKSPDWRALAAYLSTNVQPNETIIQSAADEAFTFYCLELIAAQDCDLKLPANPTQSVDEIGSVLTMRSADHTGIWYVANPPMGWSNRLHASAWLNSHMQRVRHVDFAGLPAALYKPWSVYADELPDQPLAVFRDTAALRALRVWREPDQRATIWLYWQPLGVTTIPLTVFVHIVDDAGILGQNDQPPLGGRLVTTDWHINEVFRDPVSIRYTTRQPNTEQSSHRIIIGFYDPVTAQRVPLGDGNTDSFALPLRFENP